MDVNKFESFFIKVSPEQKRPLTENINDCNNIPAVTTKSETEHLNESNRDNTHNEDSGIGDSILTDNETTFGYQNISSINSTSPDLNSSELQSLVICLVNDIIAINGFADQVIIELVSISFKLLSLLFNKKTN